MLLGNSSKKKEVSEKMQEAMSLENKGLMKEAWEKFYDGVVEDVERDIVLSNGKYIGANQIHIGQRQKHNSPFMFIKDSENRNSFRQEFDDNYSSSNSMSMDEFGKGLLFNQWSDSSKKVNRADGSILVPTEILSDIIYEASQHSVLLGNCPFLPMNEGTVLIGKVKDGVTVDFKAKYEKGHKAELGLEGIALEAKTLYAYIVIAEEDLQDLKNLDSILTKAFSMAVAKSLDDNFLYTNTNAENNLGVYPKGILDNENIKKIEINKIDYDMFAKANLEIAKNNGKANTVGFNPLVNYQLQTQKDATGQYINQPNFYTELEKTESNGLKSNDVIVFDSNQILVGVRKGMDIKMLPNLEDGTVIMRCMLRADVLPIREDHICKITINEDDIEEEQD